MVLAIWIVVGILIAFLGLFQWGRTGNVDYFMLVVLAAIWPLAVVFTAIVSPFVGIYYLGKALRK